MSEITWKPTKKQEQFCSLPDSIFEALYGGAAGGGKSEVLVMLPILRGWYKHHRFKGILFRRTYPELESEIILRSQLWYPHTGAKYNSEKRRWTWPSGAIMQFGHMEYENDARKYDSAEYNYVGFDELTSFTEFQYRYLHSRCRTSIKDLPAIVRSATNPGNVGHGFVRKRFVEPAPWGTILQDKVTTLKRIFIQSLVTDNSHIDPNYINILNGLPEAEKRAKRDGDWWTFEGQVFADWRDECFADEPSNAKHVIEPFEIPNWWPRILAIDWGFSAQTVALWGAISPDKRLYVYREYTIRNAPISTWATEIGKASSGEKITDCILCQSAWQHRGEDATTAEKFENLSGIRPRSSENDKGSRILGKLLMQEYLRWAPKPVKKVPAEGYNPLEADRILRVSGLDAHNAYLELFKPEIVESNIPRLQIFQNCSELRKTIPLCVYDNPDRVTGKPAEDVKEFNGDDPYDTIRYLVKAADRFLKDLSGEAEKYEIEAKVVKALETHKDQTRYYRQMELLERKVKNQTRPMRRFHAA